MRGTVRGLAPLVLALLVIALAPASASAAYGLLTTFGSPQSVSTPQDFDVDSGGTTAVLTAQGVTDYSPSGSIAGAWKVTETNGTPIDGYANYKGRIAVGAENGVYISETKSHRVLRFTATGTPLGAIGGPGTDSGLFEDGPRDLAADPNGDVLVLDAHRVQRFTFSGTFVSAFPHGSSDPTAIEVSPDGSIQVLDQAKQVSTFASNGQLVRRFSAGAAGSIAADTAGNLYTAGSVSFDRAPTPVSKYSATGESLGTVACGSTALAGAPGGSLATLLYQRGNIGFKPPTPELTEFRFFGENGRPMPCGPFVDLSTRRVSLSDPKLQITCLNACELTISGVADVRGSKAALRETTASLPARTSHEVDLDFAKPKRAAALAELSSKLRKAYLYLTVDALYDTNYSSSELREIHLKK